jgi:hypothetical protein
MRNAPALRNTRQAGFYIDFVARTPGGQEVERTRYGPLLNLVFPPGNESEFTFRAGSLTFEIHDVPPSGEFRCVAQILEQAKPRTLEEIAILKDADGRPVSYLKAVYAE